MRRRTVAGAGRVGIAGVAAAAAAALGYRAVETAVARRPRWWRTNFAGARVNLAAGPAAVAGMVVGSAVAGRAAEAAVAAAAGAVGLYDDLAGSAERRGLRGHLAALRTGQVTTGAVKVAGLGAIAVAAAAASARVRAGTGGTAGAARVRAGTGGTAGAARVRPGTGGTAGAARVRPTLRVPLSARFPDLPPIASCSKPRKPTLTSTSSLAEIGLDAALIAGGANLVNLFDLRPGRAAKVVAVLGLPLAAATAGSGGAGVPVLGALAGVAAPDLHGRAMLGDCGANAAGAALATAFVRAAPRPVRVLALTGVVALTLASERVSFTTVIERTPWLRRLDRLGRQPPATPEPATPAASR